MSQNNKHLTREIIDNREGTWECENCQERPDHVCMIMRGGYIQEIICSECYTELHRHSPIMLTKEVNKQDEG